MERDTKFHLGLSIVIIASLWIVFYGNYSTDGLPLGWDTPYYIWKMETASRLGPAEFIVSEGYYHAVYPILGSWVSSIGLSPFTVELVLPAILWILGSVMVLEVAHREMADSKSAVFALAAGSMWFAFFRLSSDLHASLMTLVLMLAGTTIFLRLQNERSFLPFKLGYLVLGVIVLFSSLTHIETALFLSVTWLLSVWIGTWRKGIGLKHLALTFTVLLSLVPGIVTYLNQLRLTTAPLEGRLPTVSVMSPLDWLFYFGPVGVLVLVAIVLSFRSNRRLFGSSPIIALTMSWLLLSLCIGFAQYAYPALTPFSERAIILIPTPFLAAILLPRILDFKLTRQVKGVTLIGILLIGGTGLLYAGTGYIYYDSFISHSASLSLQELRRLGQIDPERSIFVFYGGGSNAGGLSEHDNFWVAAYLGDHYAYFGRVDFLMAGLETPFADDRSKLISRRFFNTIPLDEISSMSIIYLEEFNVPRPAPSYYLSLMSPVVRGAYVVERGLWESQDEVVIPAYSSVLASSQGWRSEPQDWTLTGRALKFDSTNPNRVPNATIAFAISNQGNYNISLRLWDIAIPANPISIFVDGRQVSLIRYNGTQTAVRSTVFSGFLELGVHYLSLEIQNQVELNQFVSLDSLFIRHHDEG